MVQRILTQLEALVFRLQHWYMKSKITDERVSRHYAFFHPRPTGKIVLEEYRKRLQGPTLKVLVTGCFDVLHSEHKKLLLAARNLGGKLLVGVESDARVRELKGPDRPMNSLPLRLENLRALKLADEVFALPEKFDSVEDRLKWLKQLRPNILAVSASTPNLPAKRQLMRRIGGRVVMVLPHNPKISTTKMLKLAHAK